MTPPRKASVYLIGAADRSESIQPLLEQADFSGFRGKRITIKANFNSADPYPASTHLDTLQAVAGCIIEREPERLLIAERSGMGNTRQVLAKRGVFGLSEQMGMEVLVLDDLEADGWMRIRSPDLHWKDGFWIARAFSDADGVIQTCCLKTHRFGGHITLSLKNSVGCIARRVPGDPHDYMHELHTSPFQRQMIAEINRYYSVDFVLLDATEGFSTGGPERGKLIRPNLILGGSDRVAVDAVGVAILRLHGSTDEVMRGRIFDLEQIARAAELGIGVQSADAITLVPLDSRGEQCTEEIDQILYERR
jgi:uncharacterized protein (DUF362 family)